jgi:hypothetical protein
MQGFQNCVREAWERVVPKNQNALSVLHTKLGRIAKAIKKWSKPFVPQGKIGIVVCREVVAQLEKAQESRVLSQGEKKMIKELKLRILGLSAIEKCRARQKSRVTWFRRGDANTIFFHLVASNRRKKDFIHSLQSDSGTTFTQAEKHLVIYKHFLEHTGTYAPRKCILNFTELGW